MTEPTPDPARDATVRNQDTQAQQGASTGESRSFQGADADPAEGSRAVEGAQESEGGAGVGDEDKELDDVDTQTDTSNV